MSNNDPEARYIQIRGVIFTGKELEQEGVIIEITSLVGLVPEEDLVGIVNAITKTIHNVFVVPVPVESQRN